MRTVNLVKLKEFASKELAQVPVLRQLILGEPDVIPVEEFAMKVKMWLQVVRTLNATRVPSWT